MENHYQIKVATEKSPIKMFHIRNANDVIIGGLFVYGDHILVVGELTLEMMSERKAPQIQHL